MDKNKKNAIIFSCLFVLAVVVWIKGLTYKPHIPADPGQSGSEAVVGEDLVPAQPEGGNTPVSPKETVKIEVKSKYEVWGRSPFVNIREESKEEKPGQQKQWSILRLTGIMWDEKHPMAVINGKILKVGDVFADKKLVEIKQDSVVIEQNNVFTTLKVWKEQKQK